MSSLICKYIALLIPFMIFFITFDKLLYKLPHYSIFDVSQIVAVCTLIAKSPPSSGLMDGICFKIRKSNPR
jgi:hypothetical protein